MKNKILIPSQHKFFFPSKTTSLFICLGTYLPGIKFWKLFFFVKHLCSKHFHTAIFKTTLHPFFSLTTYQRCINVSFVTWTLLTGDISIFTHITKCQPQALVFAKFPQSIMLNWSIVYLQYCVSFKYTAKWFSYICVYFQTIFHDRLLPILNVVPCAVQ